MRVELFASAAEFLARPPVDADSCLVLDVRLPGVSGLDFQGQLAKAGNNIPIVFMTGHGDVPMSVRAMKAGALDFLIKPFRDQDMLDAVTQALERDRDRRAAEGQLAKLKASYDTPDRARARGHGARHDGADEQAGRGQLGVSEITVKIHRGHVMEKMGARSLAELVKMFQAIQPTPRLKKREPKPLYDSGSSPAGACTAHTGRSNRG